MLEFYASPIILEFGAGMVLGLLLVSNRLPVSRAPAVILGSAGFVLMLGAPSLWPDADRSIIAGIPALLIVGSAVAAERAGLTVKSPWIQLLGAASYSIYLTHFFVTQFVIKIVDRIHPAAPAAIFGSGVLCFALVVGVGVVMHRKVELPLSAFARRLLGGRSRPLPTAAIATTVEPAASDPTPESVLSPDLPDTGVIA